MLVSKLKQNSQFGQHSNQKELVTPSPLGVYKLVQTFRKTIWKYVFKLQTWIQ